ncbi:MAG TPA: DNRLRE domain-containing protein [Phycisphaerae bacterium]|nr:DNRLRE domain-containing protein [Phycisphaerae bacterium]
MRALPLIIAIPLLATGVVAGEEMVFQPVADTCISEGQPNANYGSSDSLRISSHYDPGAPQWGSGIRRALIRFDLGLLPVEATVLAVRLEAYQSDMYRVGEGLDVFGTAEAWTEGSVTWNTQPAVGAALGRMTLATSQYCSFASGLLTQTVRSWLADPGGNYGLALRFHDEWIDSGDTGVLGDTLRSRETRSGTPPRLIVEYDPTAPLIGDANLDGQVGVADLSALADHYGAASGVTWEMGDFNVDGKVGIADLTALADHYGSRKDAPVPEPGTVVLLAVGALSLLRRHRPGAQEAERPRHQPKGHSPPLPCDAARVSRPLWRSWAAGRGQRPSRRCRPSRPRPSR